MISSDQGVERGLHRPAKTEPFRCPLGCEPGLPDVKLAWRLVNLLDHVDNADSAANPAGSVEDRAGERVQANDDLVRCGGPPLLPIRANSSRSKLGVVTVCGVKSSSLFRKTRAWNSGDEKAVATLPCAEA